MKESLFDQEMPEQYQRVALDMAPVLQMSGLDGDEELGEFVAYFMRLRLHQKHDPRLCKVSTFVGRCAKRWARAQKRRRAAEAKRFRLAKDVVAGEAEPTDTLKCIEDRDVIEVMMSRLTAHQREVVREVARCNYSGAQAAHSWECTQLWCRK